MQRLFKIGDSFDFVSEKDYLCFLADNLSTSIYGLNTLQFNQIVIDIEGYFSGSLFDLFFFQCYERGKIDDFIYMGSVFSNGQFWDILQPLYIQVPLYTKISLRFNPYNGSNGTLLSIDKNYRFDVHDTDTFLFETKKVGFSRIQYKYLDDGQTDVLNVKCGFARCNLSGQIPSEHLLLQSDSMPILYQNYAGFIDSYRFAKSRPAIVYSWLLNHSIYVGMVKLFSGQVSVKTEYRGGGVHGIVFFYR